VNSLNKILFVVSGVVIGLSLTLGAWFVIDRNYTYKGVLIDPPARAADFELIDQNGEPFRLSEHRGQVVLIFFGYTNCPDECPLTLSEYKSIKDQLGSKAQDVRFVMITVDPQRDTLSALKVFIDRFDPEFYGLTADRSTLETVWRDYGVYENALDTGSDPSYAVEHSNRIYAIDANGNWRLNYPYGMDAGQIVQDLFHLIAQS
jgi:protein SCO1/2